ncbi:MAG: hypothetical protein U9P61_02940, partial [Patescibacteria group bacterium]|nr:hypothetical protein [Patescibacteria group bacterium]
TIKFSSDNKQYCAWGRFISESSEIFCVDSSGRAVRETDSYFECYHATNGGDVEISCDAYVECTIDANCSLGETCVDGVCTPQ